MCRALPLPPLQAPEVPASSRLKGRPPPHSLRCHPPRRPLADTHPTPTRPTLPFTGSYASSTTFRSKSPDRLLGDLHVAPPGTYRAKRRASKARRPSLGGAFGASKTAQRQRRRSKSQPAPDRRSSRIIPTFMLPNFTLGRTRSHSTERQRGGHERRDAGEQGQRRGSWRGSARDKLPRDPHAYVWAWGGGGGAQHRPPTRSYSPQVPRPAGRAGPTPRAGELFERRGQ